MHKKDTFSISPRFFSCRIYNKWSTSTTWGEIFVCRGCLYILLFTFNNWCQSSICNIWVLKTLQLLNVSVLTCYAHYGQWFSGLLLSLSSWQEMIIASSECVSEKVIVTFSQLLSHFFPFLKIFWAVTSLTFDLSCTVLICRAQTKSVSYMTLLQMDELE